MLPPCSSSPPLQIQCDHMDEILEAFCHGCIKGNLICDRNLSSSVMFLILFNTSVVFPLLVLVYPLWNALLNIGIVKRVLLA